MRGGRQAQAEEGLSKTAGRRFASDRRPMFVSAIEAAVE
jgi:hypothetical protein